MEDLYKKTHNQSSQENQEVEPVSEQGQCQS